MGLTRKEREKEEEAERKAEEKAAKKAELAAKRAARDAEKAAKLAEKASGSADASTPTKGENDEDAWTAEESEALVDGLRANPRGMHDTERARWEAIAGGAGWRSPRCNLNAPWLLSTNGRRRLGGKPTAQPSA